jgi:phosphoribosyl 1,2-cyclic phosphodiesterase
LKANADKPLTKVFSPVKLGNHLRLWGENRLPASSIRKVMEQIMGPPLFPFDLDVLKAELEFNDFRAGDILRPREGVILRTATLNHPGGVTGYRLEYGGKSVVYITDTEHSSEGLDQNVLTLSANADLMIYDSTYTDVEYYRHVGWGHSTWQQGVKLANAASVKAFVIFHHDPGHDDAFMDEVAKAAETARSGTVVAREGLMLQI